MREYLWPLTLIVTLVSTTLLGQAGNCTQIDSSSRPDCPRAIAFFNELQVAVRKDDHSSIASMVGYPLLTTAFHKKARIRTRTEFLSHFDQIFDSGVRCAILSSSAKDVWGNSHGFTIDGGPLWFEGIIPSTEKPDTNAPDFWTKYPLKIITVNRSGHYNCNPLVNSK